MQYYVAGFMFTENFGGVVLVRKKRPKWQDGLLNGVGGHVEEGELKLAAQIREFEEEAGVRHEEWHFLCDIEDPSPRDKKWSVRFFWCNTDKAYDTRTMTDEEVSIYDTEHIPWEEVVSNLRWLIPMAMIHDVDIIRTDTEELCP